MLPRNGLEAGRNSYQPLFPSGCRKSAVVGAEVANNPGNPAAGKSLLDATRDADLATMPGSQPVQGKTAKRLDSVPFRKCRPGTFCGSAEKRERVKGWVSAHTILKGSKIDKKTDTYVHVAGHFKPWDDRDKEIYFHAFPSGREIS